MAADSRLILHFEGSVLDGQFENYKTWIERNRETAKKAGSDFWCPSSDGKKILHHEAFSDDRNFKSHMNDWVPTVLDELGEFLEIDKIQVCGPITDEQKSILAQFGAALEYYENY